MLALWIKNMFALAIMSIQEIVFVWITSSFISIEGHSTQLVGPGPVCSSDVASYQCTRRGSVISWTVRSTCGTNSISRGFNTLSLVESSYDVRLCNSTLIFTLTSATSSSISSTLTIDRPLLLSGTRIACVDEIVQLLVVTNFTPIRRILLHTTSTQELVSNFTITWEPKDASTGIVHSSVAVTPAPPFGPTSSTNSSVSISLKVDLLYNIAITQHACSQEHTSSFALGCPLLTVFPVQKFVIHNGTMTAHYLDICVNNMWRLSKEEPSTTTRTESSTTLTMKSENCFDSYDSNSLYLHISGIFASSITTAIFTAIITTVFMRLFCEVKCRRRNRTTSSPSSSTHSHDRSLQNLAGPVYEEVDLTNKDFPLKCSQNVAYQST